ITNSSFTGNKYGIYQANDGNNSRLINFALSDSSFTGNSLYAIYAEEMRDAVIEDTVFTNNAVGIGLLKFYNGALPASNITIQNNTFTQTAGTALDLEVYASGLENPINVIGNTISLDVTALTSNASAIFVMLTDTFTHAAVNLTDNHITLSGTFGSATAAYAVRLRRNGPVVLTGNTFDGGNVGGGGNAPATSGLYIEAADASGAMPATAVITATCNRITGFRNGVSVFSSAAGTYGGLVAGAAVTLNDDDIVGNSSAGVVNGAVSETVDAQSNWWGCAAGPGNPGCDTVSGAVNAGSPSPAPAPCAPCSSAAQCDDGNPCTVDACTGSCANTAGNSGAPCRATAGVCDVAEQCDGINPACPADAKSTAVCRASAPACDVAESCDGVADDCPVDAVAPSSTVCRAATGSCDVAESCDGVSSGCPADAVAPSSTVCRAAAGVCDLAESCDGLTLVCPSDAKSTAVCRVSAGGCDVDDSCDGVGDFCPADTLQPDGTSCSDGAFCNGAEACASGVCQSGSAPCAVLCNEGTDTCESGCPATPQTCRTAERSLLVVKDNADNSKDKLTWKWIKGQSTTQLEFGDPTDDSDYALCIYAGAVPALVGQALIPASPATWSLIGSKGYKFKDTTGTPNGIVKATLKGNTLNKAKVIVKGKGGNLPDLTLPVTGVVTVQLVNGSTGLCFGADYQPPQQINEVGRLKAKVKP
ncbi:MAG: hypothetical protein ABI629_14405, partial [bacterium]